MHARSGRGGVKHNAGHGVGAVGELSALVAGERIGRVSVAGEDYGEPGSSECGAQPRRKGQGHVFLEDTVAQSCAQIRAAVRGIEHHQIMGDRRCSGGRRRRPGILALRLGPDGVRSCRNARQKDEQDGDVLAGGDQRLVVSGSLSVLRGQLFWISAMSYEL